MINNIINGWANLIKNKFGLLDKNTKAVAALRLNICNDCNIRTLAICNHTKKIINIKTGNVVNGCGCLISAKALDLASFCPAGKW